MKIRKALVRDQGPFLAGMIPCDHSFNNGSMGICFHDPDGCPICNNNQGWKLVPVMIEENQAPEPPK